LAGDYEMTGGADNTMGETNHLLGGYGLHAKEFYKEMK